MHRLVPFCFALCLLAGCTEDQSAPEAPPDSFAVEMPALRQELLAMEAADQAVRAPMAQPGFDFQNISPELVAAIDSVDEAHEARLRAIIAEHGWPRAAWVGHDGIAAAFLLIQHARLPFQQEALPYVRQWYDEGALNGQDVAMLIDRVRQREGKRQLYGTQIDIIDGAFVVGPLADSARVDALRAELALPTLDAYLELVRAAYAGAAKEQ